MDRYSTFGRRFFAGIVDVLVLFPLTYFIGVLKERAHTQFVMIVCSIVSFTIIWLYGVLLHARYGQTVGKMVANVKVLDVSETRLPSLRQAFLRDIGFIATNTLTLCYLIYLVSQGQYVPGAESSGLTGRILDWSAGVWFLLEITTMFTNKKRRALHDYIAGTVVARQM